MQWMDRGGGVAIGIVAYSASNDVLHRWPVSKRVNSSRADSDDPTLIDPIAAV
jgi:hypothetical protein